MQAKTILVIGGGSIGERHTRCFQKTGRANLLLCEPNPDVRQRVATTYGLAHAFASLDEALQHPIDMAAICAPSQLHVAMTARLVEQKIAVLVEKPLSVSMEGVDALLAQVESARVPVAVGYVHRCNPALMAMKAAIDSGRFGRPVELFVTSGQHFPFYRPAYREVYYTSRATGGGAIHDSLTHMVNAGEWLVGPITKVVGDADHCVLEGVEVEDTVHVIARHGSVLGSFVLNQHQAVDETAFSVVCERGIVRTELHNRRWMSCTEPGSAWNVEQTYDYARDDLFFNQANRFLDFADGKAPAPCPLVEGRQTLRVNLAILESVESQRWVELKS
ncbi:MAG: Gfo/Idh/MocA family oxidoreductase [Planctomycetota bacterium]|nr:Gfo/Idh/MocA family oxidoreductase [Planctomycetota bacterium]